MVGTPGQSADCQQLHDKAQGKGSGRQELPRTLGDVATREQQGRPSQFACQRQESVWLLGPADSGWVFPRGGGGSEQAVWYRRRQRCPLGGHLREGWVRKRRSPWWRQATGGGAARGGGAGGRGGRGSGSPRGASGISRAAIPPGQPASKKEQQPRQGHRFSPASPTVVQPPPVPLGSQQGSHTRSPPPPRLFPSPQAVTVNMAHPKLAPRTVHWLGLMSQGGGGMDRKA